MEISAYSTMVNPPGSDASPLPNESSDMKQEVNGDRNQVIGQVVNSNVLNVSGGTVNIHVLSNELDPSKHIPNNLPRSGAIAFVGRDDLLTRLDDQLQGNECIGITGVRGMGGIGKTELALQYAIASYNDNQYHGGICWLHARDQEIATQIVSFSKANLGIKPPDELEADEQVRFTWQRWPEGNALIILDDVTDYEAIVPSLPPPDPRFKVLITTRINLGSSVKAIEIEELSDESAIALMKSFAGDERIDSQIADAVELCAWVGNLPLGLELLGRFLARKPDWAIAKLLKRLESNRLAAKALTQGESGMTATLGVAAALELSWTELNEEEEDLACLLGMFAVAPIPWNLVEQCYEENDSDDLGHWRDDGLRDRSLIKWVEKETYQLHQIVQEFFREKLKQKGENPIALKQAFGRVMVDQSKILDDTPTLEQIEQVRGTIVHLEETINKWLSVLHREQMIWPFIGIASFYEGQGNYHSATIWFRKAFNDLKRLFGEEHIDVAQICYRLAILYYNQGNFEEATTYSLQALQLRKKLLGEEHTEIARSLNSLAMLHYSQENFVEAETFFLQALHMRYKLLETEHVDIASNLNNLALLYCNQRRYKEAEKFYLESLDMRKNLLGGNHADVASSIHNLGLLYGEQGDIDNAMDHMWEACELRKKLLGEEHFDTAASYSCLGTLFYKKEEHPNAKSLFLHALKIYQMHLGSNHPYIQNLLSWINKLPDGTQALPLEDLGL